MVIIIIWDLPVTVLVCKRTIQATPVLSVTKDSFLNVQGEQMLDHPAGFLLHDTFDLLIIDIAQQS